jgi:hypothetical protein
MRFIRTGTPPDIETPSLTSHLDSLTDPVELTSGVLNARGQVREKKYKWMRLSEIDGACAREWVLGHVQNATKIDRVAFASVCAMDMGSALHHWIQNRRTYFGSNIYGYWRCYACGNRRRFGVKPEEPCEFCSASPRATFYSEYMFRLNSPFRVVGKMDLIIRVGGKYRIVEIKTHGKDMPRAQGEHVAQLASYMYFSQFDADDAIPITIDRSVGYLVYFNKKFNYKAPVKTFPVKPTERFMKPLTDKAAAFTEGVNQGILPNTLGECSAGFWNNGRAKKCPSKESCQRLHESGEMRLEIT